MKRELLNSMALSARALGRSSLPLTNWLSSDCRSGVSKALSTPSRAAINTISVGPIRPVVVSSARATACNPSRPCTPISSRRLSCRSIQAPASGPTSNCGSKDAKVVTPSSAAEPVRR
ncbi:hypothetical protein FQZ97_657300 [compost metagenome]